MTRLAPARRRTAATALVLALAFSPLGAVTPTLWTVESVDEFERGRPDGVSIGAAGELLLSPAVTALNVPALEQSSEPFLWSLVLDAKGTVYAGGGKNGAVYRAGRGAAGSVWYESGDLAVRALALDRAGVLYAGTMPQGRIVRITGEGKAETMYQPEDRYVWALAAGAKGEIYAATGERGIIYRITGPGKADVFFDSEEFHIVTLTLDAQGNLYAGSDGRGLLYRITPQGKASVLYDSPLREIAAVAVDAKGVVYAVAVGLESEPPPQPLTAPPTVTGPRGAAPAGLPGQPPVALPGIEEPTASATITVSASATSSSSGPPPKSELYRIDPDGTVVTLWSSASETALALALDAQGRPILGTGEPARIRLVTGPQQTTLLARLPPSQVTALLVDGPRILAATSNVGRIYSLDPAQSEAGTYLSQAWDADCVARWGRIGWRAALAPGSKVEVGTRTGNSAVPDATWSDWSENYAAADGSPITSPPGRFLQWRARLVRQGSGESPILQAVSVAYVQSNLPPVVKGLKVDAPGIVRERSAWVSEPEPEQQAFTGIQVGAATAATSGGSTAGDKRVYVRGMRGMEWEADDPNQDALAYDLMFRGENETAWKPLVRGLRERYFAFDTMQIPDGLYRVRVDASDAPSNPGDRARVTSLTGESFLVDNTPPVVQVTAKRGGRSGSASIDVAATDNLGPLARAEASVDAVRWQPLSPVDGLSDSKSETYLLPLDGLRAGEHTVIVRVTDLLGNMAAGKAVFTTE